ncbi:SigB/SigF/SigG family RNA polymerase sigma factor [Nocardioides marinquilinus]|uniref:SigB/SigF/SigG family RNA polymerase sigma factor n=1 Tax=Nocardioides marinquilinus TaxID=1210400 RepID=A0ABP9PBE6_9ACTN
MRPSTFSSSRSERLSRAERSDLTAELLTRAAGTDDPAQRRVILDEVVTINVRIAHAVAARYRGRGVPLEDLEQVGCEGLTKAVQRYDHTTHHDLLTYAVPTIRGQILRYFRDLSWTLRPPRRIQDLQWRINRTIDELSLELGREPTTAEVCASLGIEAAEHDEAVAAFGCLHPPSLDQPVAGSPELTLGQGLTADDDPDEAVEARAMLQPLVRRLPERDRRILYLRFVEDQTQREIGDELGVPQMQVSRWLTRIYRELRDGLGPDADPWTAAEPA